MAALMEVGGRKQRTCGINSKGLFQAISPKNALACDIFQTQY